MSDLVRRRPRPAGPFERPDRAPRFRPRRFITPWAPPPVDPDSEPCLVERHLDRHPDERYFMISCPCRRCSPHRL